MSTSGLIATLWPTPAANSKHLLLLLLLLPCQARELSELLDFAEQERLTLLEKEAALQQELAKVKLATSAAAAAVLPVDWKCCFAVLHPASGEMRKRCCSCDKECTSHKPCIVVWGLICNSFAL